MKKLVVLLVAVVCLEILLQGVSVIQGFAQAGKKSKTPTITQYLANALGDSSEEPNQSQFGRPFEEFDKEEIQDAMGGFENLAENQEKLDGQIREVIELYKKNDVLIDKIIEGDYEPDQGEVDAFIDDMLYAYSIDQSETAPEFTSYVAVAYPEKVKRALAQYEDSESAVVAFKKHLGSLLQPIAN